MNRGAVLGVAGGGGTLLVVVALLFAILGPCNLLGFGRTAAVHPTPSATPVATASAAATPAPTPTPTAAPTSTPTPTPSATPGLIITSLPVHVGEAGVQYAPVQMAASGGKPPYTWSTSPGALPPGLSMTPGGQLAGTPTAPGDYTPTFRVDDSGGGAAGSTAAITIVSALALRAPCATTTCRVEVGCTAACLTAGTQTGGVAPYRYTLAGQLPAGTSFADSLTLAGAVAGSRQTSFQYAITVTDALGAPPQTANVDLAVYPHVAVGPAPANVTFSASKGGRALIPWSAGDTTTTATLSGNVPIGLAVNPDPPALPDVVLVLPAGNNAAQTTYTFTLTLMDKSQCGPGPGQACSASAPVTIVVGP